MSKEAIQKNLESFGLSDSEAKVYSAVLALEDAPVDKIARYAGVNRTSSYPILERLETDGLVGKAKKRGKIIYRAASPEKFLDILDEKKEKINEIMPDLKSLFSIQEGKPNVQMFEGKEGLKTVLNTILNETRGEVLIFSDGESFLKNIPGWTEAYVAKRAKKNIRVRLITKATPFNVKAAKQINAGQKEESSTTKIRLLPEGYKIDYGGFDIYNNKTVLYSFDKQNVAVAIESKVIANMMRTIFEILWSEAGKYAGNLMK